MDVDVCKDVNGIVAGYDGIAQTFINTCDSLLWVEFFVGAGNARGRYEVQILALPDYQCCYAGEASTGSAIQDTFVRAYLMHLRPEPLLKGDSCLLKITHSYGESINYCYNPTNPYKYGHLVLPGDQPSPPPYENCDLCCRIEGIDKSYDSVQQAITDKPSGPDDKTDSRKINHRAAAKR